MQRALIYCRVSSERQKNEGHGLDSQEFRCREYALQKDYEVEKVFKDSFSGGGDFMRRPAMAEMISYIDNKPYNNYVVIFDDIKRLARDTENHLKLRKALMLRKAKVECPNFVFDSSPEGKYVETIMAAGAELEREQNRRQVMQKMRARLEMGYWPFPSLPVGYKHYKDGVHKNSTPKPHEPLASLIKEVLVGYASGRFIDQVDVQRYLQEKNFKAGKYVYTERVKGILQNSSFYAGYIEYPEWEVSLRKGQHEPLIDLATHQIIKDKLSGKSRTFIKRILNPDFPLRGFVCCFVCKQSMTGSWSKGRNGRFGYYRCKTKGCSEVSKSVPKKRIEKEFLEILGNIQPSPNVLELTKAIVQDVWKKKESEVSIRREGYKKELEEINLEKTRLLERITRASDDNVIGTYEARLGEIAEHEMVLKDSIKSFDLHKPNIGTALDIVFDFLKNPLVQWEKGDIQRKKLVLKLIFEEKLAYSKSSGFETATLSLPLRIFCLPEAQKSCLVDIVSESWNQLGSWVFEASEAILEAR